MAPIRFGSHEKKLLKKAWTLSIRAHSQGSLSLADSLARSRAFARIEFYSAVLKRPLMKMPGMDSVAIPAPDQPPGEGNGGAQPEGPMPVAFDLVQTENLKPSFDGCTIYFNADDDPEGMLQRAADAGGEILSPLQDMGEMVGWIGFFKDTEGNRIGVHKSHS